MNAYAYPDSSLPAHAPRAERRRQPLHSYKHEDETIQQTGKRFIRELCSTMSRRSFFLLKFIIRSYLIILKKVKNASPSLTEVNFNYKTWNSRDLILFLQSSIMNVCPIKRWRTVLPSQCSAQRVIKTGIQI